MNATDLRLGNYLFDSKNKEWVIVIELKYDETFSIIHAGKQREREVIEASDIEGITLTETLLSRCGFNRSDYYPTLRSIQLKKESPSKWSVYVYSKNGTEIAVEIFYKKKIYLHELQNLFFALYGEELSIR